MTQGRQIRRVSQHKLACLIHHHVVSVISTLRLAQHSKVFLSFIFHKELFIICKELFLCITDI